MNRSDSGNGNSGAKAKPAPFTPPQVSLPKGGGAIRGIGEKFAANPVTGTGSLTVPIAVSPGRSGFGPQLALSLRLGRWQRAVWSGVESVAFFDHAQNQTGFRPTRSKRPQACRAATVGRRRWPSRTCRGSMPSSAAPSRSRPERDLRLRKG